MASHQHEQEAEGKQDHKTELETKYETYKDNKELVKDDNPYR